MPLLMWTGPMWFIIHAFPLLFPLRHDSCPGLVSAYEQFYELTISIVPCHECQHHIRTQFLSVETNSISEQCRRAIEFDSNKSQNILYDWSVKMHNFVNAKLHLQLRSHTDRQLISTYSSAPRLAGFIRILVFILQRSGRHRQPGALPSCPVLRWLISIRQIIVQSRSGLEQTIESLETMSRAERMALVPSLIDEIHSMLTNKMNN